MRTIACGDRPSEAGVLPLGYAAFYGYHKLCKILVAQGAKMNGHPKIDGGRTPLHYAVYQNKVRSVAMLTEPLPPSLRGLLYDSVG